MPFDLQPAETIEAARETRAGGAGIRLGALLCVTALGAMLGALPASPAAADLDLARLMMAMALLKAVIAAALTAIIGWRLKSPAPRADLALYLAASGAMTAGVVLMARMASPLGAAVLLHAGLFGAALLILRDRTIIEKLKNEIARRRTSPRLPDRSRRSGPAA